MGRAVSMGPDHGPWAVNRPMREVGVVFLTPYSSLSLPISYLCLVLHIDMLIIKGIKPVA